MAAPSSQTPGAHGPVGRLLERVTGAFALAGGLLMVAVMMIESASIIGRGLATVLGPILPGLPIGSIPGDTEIVEVGGAVAIFAFLPYCQMTRANVFVDFFTHRLPLRARAALDLVANLLFLALSVAIAWQLGHGAYEKWSYGDTTTVLRIPEAWPYGLSLVSAWLLAIATAYTVARSFNEILQDRLIGPHPSMGH